MIRLTRILSYVLVGGTAIVLGTLAGACLILAAVVIEEWR